MRIRNLTTLLFGPKVTSRQPEMTMIVRTTFDLRHGNDEERVGARLYPGDFADYKPHAEEAQGELR